MVFGDSDVSGVPGGVGSVIFGGDGVDPCGGEGVPGGGVMIGGMNPGNVNNLGYPGRSRGPL